MNTYKIEVTERELEIIMDGILSTQVEWGEKEEQFEIGTIPHEVCHEKMMECVNLWLKLDNIPF